MPAAGNCNKKQRKIILLIYKYLGLPDQTLEGLLPVVHTEKGYVVSPSRMDQCRLGFARTRGYAGGHHLHGLLLISEGGPGSGRVSMPCWSTKQGNFAAESPEELGTSCS